MTTPTIDAATTYSSSAVGSIHTATWPTVSAGNLILAFVTPDQTSVSAVSYSGSTTLTSGTSGGNGGFCLYSTASGAETGNMVFTLTGDTRNACIRVYSISGANTTPVAATAVTGSSAAPNSGSVTIAGDALAFSYAANNGIQNVLGYPSGYGNTGTSSTTDSSGNVMQMWATKAVTTTEDAGAFSVDSSTQWVALGVAALGTGTVIMRRRREL